MSGSRIREILKKSPTILGTTPRTARRSSRRSEMLARCSSASAMRCARSASTRRRRSASRRRQRRSTARWAAGALPASICFSQTRAGSFSTKSTRSSALQSTAGSPRCSRRSDCPSSRSYPRRSNWQWADNERLDRARPQRAARKCRKALGAAPAGLSAVDAPYAALLDASGQRYRVHLKLDTGMHRLGGRLERILL